MMSSCLWKGERQNCAMNTNMGMLINNEYGHGEEACNIAWRSFTLIHTTLVCHSIHFLVMSSWVWSPWFALIIHYRTCTFSSRFRKKAKTHGWINIHSTVCNLGNLRQSHYVLVMGSCVMVGIVTYVRVWIQKKWILIGEKIYPLQNTHW